jgi:hypothetical protein
VPDPSPTAVPPVPSSGWVALIEGFYGPPYRHEDRLALLRWMPSVGLTDYAYGPKDDVFQRESWREPYPAEELAHFAETLAVAQEAGVRLTLAVSPGLDWRGADDHPALVAKLRQLHDLGVRSLGVYWDDVAPGGEELGRSHGRGVAAARAGLPDDVRWMTCGTDYAFDTVTAYLRGFAAELPAGTPIAWTGPDITSPVVTAEVASRLAAELGHPLLLCDNWPVNDLGMAGQLHLGPAPYREPALRSAVVGMGFNTMALPLASRVGLSLGARHWLHPEEDREQAWLSVVSSYPGLLPLARGCRGWVDAPGPDPLLVEWLEAGLAGDDRLLGYLDAGCRTDLDPAVEAELEPWLASWEAEARVLGWVVRTCRGETSDEQLELGSAWLALHRREAQVFGTRLALYGLSHRLGPELGERLLPHPASIVRGENLTDLAVRRGLEILHALGT